MPITKGQMFFIAQQVQAAAFKERNPGAFEMMMQTNKRTPLNIYFLRIADYVARHKFTVAAAFDYVDRLHDAEAHEVIFDLAAPRLYADPGAYGLSADDLHFIRIIRATAKNYIESAYMNAPALRVANDAGSPPPVPA